MRAFQHLIRRLPWLIPLSILAMATLAMAAGDKPAAVPPPPRQPAVKKVPAPPAARPRKMPEKLVSVPTARGIVVLPAKIFHGPSTSKVVALTFDDGPHHDFTPQLLAILKKYNVRATFFLVGLRAEQNPDLVRAELADGHSIGNHTYHHYRFAKTPGVDVLEEIKTCGDLLEQITGQRIYLFRPPGGGLTKAAEETIRKMGYVTVMWSGGAGDWNHPPAKTIISRSLRGVHNGSIILLHDGIAETMEALPTIITTLKSQGYQFVTVEELIGIRPLKITPPAKTAPPVKEPVPVGTSVTREMPSSAPMRENPR